LAVEEQVKQAKIDLALKVKAEAEQQAKEDAERKKANDAKAAIEMANKKLV